jgi:glycosyltransferase involved in cell wall biosynthesis
MNAPPDISAGGRPPPPAPIDPAVADWLKAFEARNGRKLKILHVGNVANNAYNNAKVQRRFGVDAHVIAADYYHVMGCPEWEDAEIEGKVADSFLPDFWSVNLGGFVRPRWFAQGPLELARRYMLLLNHGRAGPVGLYWRYLEAFRYQLVKPGIAAFVEGAGIDKTDFKKVTLFVERLAGRDLGGLHPLSATVKTDIESHAILARAKSLEPAHMGRWPAEALRERLGIHGDDFKSFYPAALAWLPLFAHYDMIQAYATDPIWPLLCQLPNFVAYEHGTIREIPFQDNNIGRLTRIAYRHAPAAFITNVDNIKAADRLGMTSGQRAYLPHAFDYQKLLAHQSKSPGAIDRAAPPSIFMPSRQDWVVKDPNWAKGNDLVIRAARLLKDRGLSFRIKFIEWGKDIEASRDLIRELGVGDRFVWSPLLNKRGLWDEYMRSALVVDQFLLPGISGVSFESMTLGTPVITCDEPGLNRKFFGVEPPLLTANTAEDAASHIERAILKEEWRADMGRKSAEWIARHHSTERIFEIQMAAIARIVDHLSTAALAQVV